MKEKIKQLAKPGSETLTKFLIKEWSDIGYDRSDLPLAISAFFYLRWLAFKDAEGAAAAEFEDSTYQPLLPETPKFVSWRALDQLKDDDLGVLFRDYLPEILIEMRVLMEMRVRDSSEHDFLNLALLCLKQTTSNFLELSRLYPQVLHMICAAVYSHPFDTPEDHRQASTWLYNVTHDLDSRSWGEHRTRPDLAALLAAIADPKPGGSIYDPCFGVGQTLIAACDYARKEVGVESRKSIFSTSRTGKVPMIGQQYDGPLLDVYGAEISQNSYVVGLTRLCLAGIEHGSVHCGDPHNENIEKSFSSGFDTVIMDPPFGGKVVIHPEHYPVRSSDTVGYFIQHALDKLRPGGRAVAVVADSFLWSRRDAELRKHLIENHTVEAVVSLPSGLIPLTAIRPSILVLRSGGKTETVRMLDQTDALLAGPKFFSNHRIESAVEWIRRSPLEKTWTKVWDVEKTEISSHHYDLSVTNRGAEKDLLAAIRPMESEWDLVRLDNCCKVKASRGIRVKNLIDRPGKTPASQLRPYVRIGDLPNTLQLQTGEIKSTRSWVNPIVEQAMLGGSVFELREDDVLLSKSGTIGKLGRVSKGIVGGFASSGLHILRPDKDRIDPRFLEAYLRCPEVQDWLNARMRGTVVQHLNTSSIRELLIPLPPIHVQHRMLKASKYLGDLIPNLRDRLPSENIAKGTLYRWVESCLSQLEGQEESNDLALLESFARSMPDSVSPYYSPEYSRDQEEFVSDEVNSHWSERFDGAIMELLDLTKLPKGSALLSILQHKVGVFDEPKRLVERSKSDGDLVPRYLAIKIDQFIDQVQNILRNATRQLLEEVIIEVSSTRDTLLQGGEVDLELIVTNKSPLPLHTFYVMVRNVKDPDWQAVGKSDYLAEMDGVFSVSGPYKVPLEGETATFRADWYGQKIDGESVKGSQEIVFNLADEVPEGDSGDKYLETVIENPYITGVAVPADRHDVFFGRDELLESIRNQIIDSGNVVLLEGNRKLGKSSTILRLVGLEKIPGWLCVFVDFEGAEGQGAKAGVPTVEVYRLMAREIAMQLRQQFQEYDTPLPGDVVLAAGEKFGISKAVTGGISNNSPFTDFQDYLKTVLELLEERNLGLVLILDEFDNVIRGIHSGVTAANVPYQIRSLIQRNTKFTALFTGATYMRKLREQHSSALFSIGLPQKLSVLSEGAAKQLVTQPVKKYLTYTSEALDCVVYETGRHPLLLQHLCNRIVGIANELKSRTVDKPRVDQAISRLLEQHNEYFVELWQFEIKNKISHAILFLLQRLHDDGWESKFEDIHANLETFGKMELDATVLAEQLEQLTDLEVIERVGSSARPKYVHKLPLFGRWIAQEKNFESILSEVRKEISK